MKLLKLRLHRLLRKKKNRVPILELKQITDFEWQLRNLSDRLHIPQKYESENITESIKRINLWLSSHLKEATAEELELYTELSENEVY